MLLGYGGRLRPLSVPLPIPIIISSLFLHLLASYLEYRSSFFSALFLRTENCNWIFGPAHPTKNTESWHWSAANQQLLIEAQGFAGWGGRLNSYIMSQVTWQHSIINHRRLHYVAVNACSSCLTGILLSTARSFYLHPYGILNKQDVLISKGNSRW